MEEHKGEEVKVEESPHEMVINILAPDDLLSNSESCSNTPDLAS